MIPDLLFLRRNPAFPDDPNAISCSSCEKDWFGIPETLVKLSDGTFVCETCESRLEREELAKTEIKIGDMVGHVFAQPGNDTTYGVVTGIREETFDLHDLTFGHESTVKKNRAWKATRKERQQSIGRMRNGVLPHATYEQLFCEFLERQL